MSFQTFDRHGMLIRAQALGKIATNSYIVGCEATGQGAVIDSCAQIDAIEAMTKAKPALTVSSLLQTHAHIDHVAALAQARTLFDAPIYIHPDEMPLYEAAPLQGQMFGIHTPPLPPPDKFWSDGDEVTIGQLTGQVMLTPGHTPGHVCLYFEAQKVLFSGDLLFAGSIGRTDLPGGHAPTILKSLLRVVELPDDTLVLSGHGPATTIGREKTHNPFIRMARERA